MSSSPAAEAPAGRWRRADSLFTRLLLVQALLVLGLGLVLGSVMYVERHRQVAQLYADRWGQPIAAATGLRASETSSAPVELRQLPPGNARRTWDYSPRILALRDTLAQQGLMVDEVRLQGPRAPGGAMVWLHLVNPERSAVWVGVHGPLSLPVWSPRASLAFGLAALLVVACSWWFTRRLTRPLERLQAHMMSHTPGQPMAAAAPVITATTPEIAAIANAYDRLLARYEQHERERGVLLAGVSHDLRSPLGRIRMATALMPDDPALQPRKDSIVRSVQDADRLIESFLDYVRSGTLALDEAVDLAAVTREVVARFELPPETLSLKAPDTLLRAGCHGLLVERMVANLIDNALKHGQAPVAVRLQTDAAGGVQLQVQDHGPGLAPEEIGAMQEAFTRGDASRSRPGSGLGLAIVRQVAQRLGGRLLLQGGAGGRGLVCTVQLPAAAAAEAGPGAPTAA